jgi:hypothetical protein
MEWNNLTFTLDNLTFKLDNLTFTLDKNGILPGCLVEERNMLLLQGTNLWIIKPAAWLLWGLKYLFSFTSR